MSALICSGAMGNNIQDYIVKVATGQPVWRWATTPMPVDVLVIIELISGGKQGAPGSGSCLRVLASLTPSMNAAVQHANYKNYLYKYVPSEVIGTKEVVGVLYNTKTLQLLSSGLARYSTSKFIQKRTAFLARFNKRGNPLNIAGIHGPTSTPPRNYTKSVVFTNQLAGVAQINQSAVNPKEDLCVGGDFNCDPKNAYSGIVNGTRQSIAAFSELTSKYQYKITLPNGTLTSLRKKLDTNQTPPANYLSQPYDNIVFQLPSQNLNPLPTVRCVDLIGNSLRYATNSGVVFNASRKVSDHLPVTIDW